MITPKALGQVSTKVEHFTKGQAPLISFRLSLSLLFPVFLVPCCLSERNRNKSRRINQFLHQPIDPQSNLNTRMDGDDRLSQSDSNSAYLARRLAGMAHFSHFVSLDRRFEDDLC